MCASNFHKFVEFVFTRLAAAAAAELIVEGTTTDTTVKTGYNYYFSVVTYCLISHELHLENFFHNLIEIHNF